MRQAWSKEYAHELVELLPGSQVNGAIQMLESMVGLGHLALVDVAADERLLGESLEILGHGELVSHTEFLAASGGTVED
jgi:hypothetical protein